MPDVKWIKIVTDIFDDDKILLIESMPDADAIIVIWFKMLCLAGKQNNSGVFLLNERIRYTDEMLATIFRRPLNTIRLALNTFEKFGMIEIVNDTITIPNWEKHQKMDALEASRDATRKRVARYRSKQKMLAEGGNEAGNVDCNVTYAVTVTSSNADRIDKNRLDKNISTPNNIIYNTRVREEEQEQENPYGNGEEPRTDTVYAYASSQLKSLGYRAMEEISSFVDDLSEDIVRHAIDNALDQGVRTWAYVKAILNGYVDADVKTVGDAKALDEERVEKKRMDEKSTTLQTPAENNDYNRPRTVKMSPAERKKMLESICGHKL